VFATLVHIYAHRPSHRLTFKSCLPVIIFGGGIGLLAGCINTIAKQSARACILLDKIFPPFPHLLHSNKLKSSQRSLILSPLQRSQSTSFGFIRKRCETVCCTSFLVNPGAVRQLLHCYLLSNMRELIH
jgi:hypothetical protein